MSLPEACEAVAKANRDLAEAKTALEKALNWEWREGFALRTKRMQRRYASAEAVIVQNIAVQKVADSFTRTAGKAPSATNNIIIKKTPIALGEST